MIGGDEEWVLQNLQRDPAEAGRILGRLAARGKLDDLIDGFDGAEEARLFRALPRFCFDARTAAAFAGALLTAGDARENRLAVHWVFDRARAGSFLDATLAELRRTHGANPVVLDLIAQAKLPIRPAMIMHRGGDIARYPENTMEALRAGIAAGMEAVEIDVTVTRDGQIVLWHDYAPEGLVATMREAGLEPVMSHKPLWPPVGHPARRPIHEPNWASVGPNLGYAARDGNNFTNERAPYAVPRLDEVAATLRANPQVRTIMLDVKLPPGNPEVHRCFAIALRETLDRHGIGAERVLVLQPDCATAESLKRELGGRYAIAHDVEIVSLAPDAGDYSAVAAARRLGSPVASIGRLRIGVGGYDVYKDVLRRDRAAIDGAGRREKLYAWTINDELEMRELLAIGVDGIITDRPALLARVVAASFPR